MARRFGPFVAGAGSTGRSSGAASSGTGAGGRLAALAATTFDLPPSWAPRSGRPGAGLRAGSNATSSSCFAALPAGFPLPFAASDFRPIASPSRPRAPK